jgi:hypothetical protein
VRHGVVTLNRGTTGLIEGDFDSSAGFRSFISFNKVQDGLTRLLRIGHTPLASALADHGGIAYLSAHFSVTDAAIQNNDRAIFYFGYL